MSSNAVKEFIDFAAYNKQDIAGMVKRERLKSGVYTFLATKS